MNLRAPKKRPTLRLLAGWCGLLLYVGALSPVGIAMTAFLAGLDSDHQMLFQLDAVGTRLVLHHQGPCAGHQHHAVARALNFFAQPAGAHDPDHVLQFSSTNGFLWDASFAVPAMNQSDPVVIAADETFTLVAGWRSEFILVPTSPPTDIVESLLNVRSTVLLI